MHWPAVTVRAIAAIEGAAEEHVLGADEDGGAFGVDVPLAAVLTAHEDVNTDFSSAVFRFIIPI
ncbi:MAG TPA: hypothetical protein VH597_07530 [Verrucomicrobiae bacterium]|nr:hypothetical protein [Verrucomicrobiae bacterium]HEX4264174.1 hypothetical protein [Verrucomicrobiae bacterium]